jgi:methyltransferase (TIGR00027 family)
MEAGRASRSEMGSGLLRAAHVSEDPPPSIFEDTLAVQLLDASEVAELEASMATWTPAVRAAFRASHAVRARLAEDVTIAGLAAGRDRYVLLGAGLDTFSWRHPQASAFVVSEVDHPDTQAWKRAALARAGWVEPPNVRFLAVDLSTSAIDDLELPDRATWNWLGVTMYLERSVTEATLRSIASRRAGTTLVVNFLVAPESLDALGQAVRTASTLVVTASEEPVVSTYSSEEVVALLGDAGFNDIELFDAHGLSERYLPGRLDVRLPNSTVIAVATV